MNAALAAAQEAERVALLALALANYLVALARLQAPTARDYRDARLQPTTDETTRIQNGADIAEALAAVVAVDALMGVVRVELRAALPGYLGPYAPALYEVLAPPALLGAPISPLDPGGS